MAIDQAIFEAHAAGIAPATVRVYTWGRSAVTIGRLQSEGAARAEFDGLPCIRRPTGGKAVLHGDDLTIAVAAKEELIRPLLTKRGLLACYFLLLEPVVATLREYGIDVERGIERDKASRSEDCFARIAACDLVNRHSGAKILGCAQLRAGGTILQQMSLRPLQKVQIAGDEFEYRLRHKFAEVLQIGSFSIETELSVREHTRAIEIESNPRSISSI